MMNGEVLMFPRSPDRLREDFKELMAKFDAERAELWAEHELLKSALAGDDFMLSKESAPDAALAKVEAAALKAQHGEFADTEITKRALSKLRDAVWAFNDGFDEIERQKRRSARFFGSARR
jgi:hypothetical protein